MYYLRDSLRLPRLLWSSSLPLALHFELQHVSQNMPIIPPQHMPVLSHSICLCHLNHCFLQSQHLHQVLCPLFLHHFCTTHCSLSPSQNCYLIFPQTPCLTPIITSPLLHNSDKPFLSPSCHHLHSPYPPNNRNLSPFQPLHITPPPLLLIHQLASCIFHTQNLSPTWFEFVRLIAGTKFSRRDNDFHQINRVTQSELLWRLVPATCHSDLSPSVSRPLGLIRPKML